LVVLHGSPRSVTDKLQRVLNAAARVITNTKKYDSGLSRILHHDLHWLDVTERIQFRVAATVYQCLRGMAPAYLTELCIRLSLRQQVVVAVFGPSQPATWSYHAADCQPTAPVRSVSLVQSAGYQSQNYGVSLAIWDHTVLPAGAIRHKRTHLAVTSASEDWYLIYLPRRDGRLSWPGWLVTYRDGLPAHRRSPIQVVTGPSAG